jgi:hypothetical protein
MWGKSVNSVFKKILLPKGKGDIQFSRSVEKDILNIWTTTRRQGLARCTVPWWTHFFHILLELAGNQFRKPVRGPKP